MEWENENTGSIDSRVSLYYLCWKENRMQAKGVDTRTVRHADNFESPVQKFSHFQCLHIRARQKPAQTQTHNE